MNTYHWHTSHDKVCKMDESSSGDKSDLYGAVGHVQNITCILLFTMQVPFEYIKFITKLKLLSQYCQDLCRGDVLSYPGMGS